VNNAARVLLIMLGVVVGLQMSAFSGERTSLTVYHSELRSYGWGRRVALRFDLTGLKKGARIDRAMLHLSGMKFSQSVEINPAITAWGCSSPDYLKSEKQGIWTQDDLKKYGGSVVRDIFRRGAPEWAWSVFGVSRWKTAGGDFGPSIGTLKPENGTGSLEITRLAEVWFSDPKKNLGLIVKLAVEKKGAMLGFSKARLVLEGTGLEIDETIRLDDRPEWLPATYKVQHPRLPYPTKKWLAEVKANPKYMAKLRKEAGWFKPERARADRISSLILAQRFDPTPERAAKISAAVDAPFPNHGRFSICYGLALLYDWGYDLLTPKERRRLAARLELLCTAEEEGSGQTQISPFNDVGGSRYGCGLMWAALAIYPDIPTARKHLWRAKAYYLDTTIPVWRHVMGKDGGYWHEIHGYYLERCLGQLMQRLLPAWSFATGEDLFKKHPWLENHLYFGIYSTRPDFYRIKIGDIKCDMKEYSEVPIVMPSYPMLAQRYDNPYGRWWLQFNSHLGYDRRWVKFDGLIPTAEPWGQPFRKDAKTKSWDSLPTVRYSDGFGVVNLRSDWSENATWIWFRAGRSFASHSHFDVGTFGIYKRGALALDAGAYVTGYNSPHMVQYAKMSIAHNLVTVTDPNEPIYSRAKWTFPNDGGQRRIGGVYGTSTVYSVPEWKHRSDDFDTGGVIAFQPEKDFTYVCADITKAYTNKRSGSKHAPSRSKRVNKMLRSMVFLPPDHLVILDQVESVNKDFKKRWLLHTINEPQVQGNLVTVKRADLAYKHNGWDKRLKHSITADKKTHSFFKKHSDADIQVKSYQPCLYQYDGVMFVRALLPEKVEMVKVGGPGKECWIDGKNRSKSQWKWSLKFRPYTGEGEAGRWRLEISPKTASEKDLFLNVIQVGLSSKGNKPTAARLIKGGPAPVIEIELGGGRKAVISFKPGVGGHIRITSIGGNGDAVDCDFAEKVLPNLKIEK
jgi:Heparinase II/III-like protein